MLDSTRIYAGSRERLKAGRQLIVTQPCKSRLAVDDLFLVEKRDASVVNMYRETSH